MSARKTSLRRDAAPVGDAAELAENYGVIDVGSSAIRLSIASYSPGAGFRQTETLNQSVSLGADTFRTGTIANETIEASVRAMRKFKRVLEENLVVDPACIRCVATNAVREASNRLAFVDRIYMATGLELEVIDEAEVTRLTYHGVNRLLTREPELSKASTLVIEVGGGSTEVLQLQNEYVKFSHTYRLGILRLQQALEHQRLSAAQYRDVLERQIKRTISEMSEHIEFDGKREMLALGGEARFAAARLCDWDGTDIARIPLRKLARFAEEILALPEDEIVRRYHLSFEAAQTLGMALLVKAMIAQRFGMKRILVGDVSMRDGVLIDLAMHGEWKPKFTEQILHSALELGHRYQFDEQHARQVSGLAGTLYRELQKEHGLESRYEFILRVAALLHEIGNFVSDRMHHKHSMYLILHSEIFGLGERDRTLIALIARYHRKATPQSDHEGYSSLPLEQRTIVSKLAAILRVADALDRGHSRRMRDITCRVRQDELIIQIPNVDDLSLENLAMREKGGMFEEVFGLHVSVKRLRQV